MARTHLAPIHGALPFDMDHVATSGFESQGQIFVSWIRGVSEALCALHDLLGSICIGTSHDEHGEPLLIATVALGTAGLAGLLVVDFRLSMEPEFRCDQTSIVTYGDMPESAGLLLAKVTGADPATCHHVDDVAVGLVRIRGESATA